MNRWMGLALAPTMLACTSAASAQVFVRAPFVRVQVGDPGVHVRAPFVNLNVPGNVYYPPVYGPVITQPPGYIELPRSTATLQLPAPPPNTTYVNPPIINPAPQSNEPAPLEILPTPRQANGPDLPPIPQPKIDPDLLPPQPVNPPAQFQPAPPIQIQPAPQQAVQAMTIEDFARTFQPKAGQYEVTLINPLTREPNQVRFTLPDGTPRVSVFRRDIEFRYPGRGFVRIEFDRDGAQVISR
jgi:hypothetical protein